jgi:hypothetical protein
MGHRGRNDLAEIDRASDFSGRVERTGPAGYAKLDALDGDRAVAMHILTGGRTRAEMDGSGLSTHASVGRWHTGQTAITEIDCCGGRAIGGRDGIILLAE